MSDTSSGWATSEDNSSGNEYSVRTKKDKLEELEEQKINKKVKKKKRKHKKSKKTKYKSDNNDSGNDNKNNNSMNCENDKGKSEANNENDDIKNKLLGNGPVNNKSVSPSCRSQSPVRNRSRKDCRSRSLSRDKKRGRSQSRSQSPTKVKQKTIPASYRSPERQKSKGCSKSRTRSKSRSRSRSRIRSRSRDRTWRSSVTRRRSTSRDRRFNKRTTFNYNRRNRERSRSRDKNRSRSPERRNRSRSRERRNRSRSREKRNRGRTRSRSKSYDKKRYKSHSPSPKKDSSVANKTSSSWDAKVTLSAQTSTSNSNGVVVSTGVKVFVPISTDNSLNKDKDKIDHVFTHSKGLASTSSKGGIEINIPAAPTLEKEKEKEYPKPHLYGKWEAYEKPEDKAETALSKFTRMCREISAKEGTLEHERKQEKAEPVHHPFTINRAPSYAPPLVSTKTPTTPAEAIMAGSMLSLMAPTAESTMSGPLEKHFPVSSGTDHRAKCNSTATDADVQNTPVYEETKPQPEINVSAVIARRLGAQQILTTNPNDYSATLVMAECDQKLKKWSAMNRTPGKFTGEVGVKMNKKEMFTVGSNESVVRKDFFHNLRPVTGGIGMKMLQNMGWKEGQPLGKSMQGFVAPISIDVKVGRAGLSAAEEIHRNLWTAQYQTPTTMPTPMPSQKRKPPPPVVNIGGKHPVSALSEICTKRKMAIPEYTVVQEIGPSFAKVFLMKVEVENVAYQPNEPSPNKKHAKAMAATLALQSLGLLDESPS